MSDGGFVGESPIITVTNNPPSEPTNSGKGISLRVITESGPKELVPGDKWDRSVMHVNVPPEVLCNHIKSSIRRQLPQTMAYQPNDQEIAIICGGWSLNDTIDELHALVDEGVKLVAVNGSAKWLSDHGFRASMYILLDAREVNVEFVRDLIAGCKYFLASQCHPTVFDVCEGRDVTLFHITADDSGAEKSLLDEFYGKGHWTTISACGTVGMTALLLCRTLGFQSMHLFGFDSCCNPKTGEHHGYAQPQNDGDGTAPFACGDREFMCTAWHASQAQLFAEIVTHHHDLFQLEVHGDGLIHHMLARAAALTENDPEGDTL